MTVEEMKEKFLELKDKPENAEAFLSEVEKDYSLLEASKAKIAEQASQLETDKKTIQDFSNKAILDSLTKEAGTVSEEHEDEADPKKEFQKLFRERYYNEKEEGK